MAFEDMQKDPLLVEIKKQDIKEQAIGITILIVMVTLAFFGGRADGIDEGRETNPQVLESNTRVELKLDRIQKAIDADVSCRTAFLNEAHQIKKEGN